MALECHLPLVWSGEGITSQVSVVANRMSISFFFHLKIEEYPSVQCDGFTSKRDKYSIGLPQLWVERFSEAMSKPANHNFTFICIEILHIADVDE